MIKKETKTHIGSESEDLEGDSYYYNPLEGVKHENTIIFLHGLGDSGFSFYNQIFTTLV